MCDYGLSANCFSGGLKGYILLVIALFILVAILLLGGKEDEWVKNMPEGYMIVGRSFSSDLEKDEIEKIADNYFEENRVHDFRVYCFNKKKKLFSVEYMTEKNDERELLEPLLKLINTKKGF